MHTRRSKGGKNRSCGVSPFRPNVRATNITTRLHNKKPHHVVTKPQKNHNASETLGRRRLKLPGQTFAVVGAVTMVYIG